MNVNLNIHDDKLSENEETLRPLLVYTTDHSDEGNICRLLGICKDQYSFLGTKQYSSAPALKKLQLISTRLLSTLMFAHFKLEWSSWLSDRKQTELRRQRAGFSIRLQLECVHTH